MAAPYFHLEPEVAGSPSRASPTGAGRTACVFDSWLGDDVVRAYPLLLVTTRAKRALLALEAPSGFEIVRARALTSAFYRRHSPGKRLPVFWVIQVDGRAGRDDMGLTEASVLVVSKRVLDAFLETRILRAVISQYEDRGGETSARPLASRHGSPPRSSATRGA